MAKRKNEDKSENVKISSVGAYISGEEACELCENFAKIPSKQNYTLFGKNKLLALLEQPGCEGLKFYYAAHKESRSSRLTLVVAGVDAKGNIIKDRELFMNRGIDCPPICIPPQRFSPKAEFLP